MPLAPKFFIFTDEETSLVLLVKRSARYDYLIALPGVCSYSLSSSGKISAPRPLVDGYHPSRGSTPLANAPFGDRISLLKAKLDALIFLRTACGMLMDEIRASLSRRKIQESGFRGEAFRSYFLLVSEERRIVLCRIRKFLREMESKLGLAGTRAELEHEMRQFQENVNLGVYSTANQERKNIDR